MSITVIKKANPVNTSLLQTLLKKLKLNNVEKLTISVKTQAGDLFINTFKLDKTMEMYVSKDNEFIVSLDAETTVETQKVTKSEIKALVTKDEMPVISGEPIAESLAKSKKKKKKKKKKNINRITDGSL